MTSRNRLASICSLVCLTLLLTPFGSLAEVRAVQIKAALIVNIANYVTWPPSDSPQFVMACYGPSDECDLLKSIEGRSRKGKAIEVIQTRKQSELKQAQVVFIAKQYSDQIPLLASALRQSETLIITESEEANNKHTMINLVPKQNRYEFLVNKPNITFEQLQIEPDLLLIGGTEMDVAQLYRQMEESNRQIQANNQKVQAELEAKQKELSSIRAQLQQKESALNNMEKEYQRTLKQVEEAKSSLQQQSDQYQDNESELARMSRELAEKERAVKAQQETVHKLTNEINEQLILFNQLEMDILHQNQKLSQQANQLEDKTQQIEVQNTLMLIGLLVVSIVLLATSVIYRFFLQNKRTNRELSHTLSMLKETQGKLVESEKMASLGSLVTGMAHELNTPIGTSICCISSLGESVRDVDSAIRDNTLTKAKMMEFLGLVHESESLLTSSLQRCADLVHNFKQVSADQAVAEPREIQLLNYLSEIFGTLSVQLKRNRVQHSLQGDNPTLWVDPGLLVQIITNLTMNAINHAFDGNQEPEITVKVVTTNSHSEIHFRDNGIGLSEEVKRKIFDPFFTTKRGIGGTGLGMNIVYNLVTVQLHGEISVISEQGHGTEFVIQIPKTSTKLEPNEDNEASSSS